MRKPSKLKALLPSKLPSPLLVKLPICAAPPPPMLLTAPTPLELPLALLLHRAVQCIFQLDPMPLGGY